MEKYKKYKEAFPNKTDAQCIDSLCWEVSDKVETIHKLLAELEQLRQPPVIKSVCVGKDIRCDNPSMDRNGNCRNCEGDMQTDL